ncbi:DMT family transporter [Candidatus Microgenomates bacterium]|nr:DMT family transporter [Candidatus Microgenomates bacterium]
MNSNHRQLAFLALILASIIWGASAAVMKITLFTVPPFSLALIRFGAAALLFLPLVWKNLIIKKEDLPAFLLLGLIGFTVHIPLFLFGLKLTTALNAGIIVSSVPLFTLLLASIFLKEKIKINLVLGIILGIAGVGIIIGKDAFATGVKLSPFGDMLILTAMLLFVFYEILSKKLFRKYSVFVVTFYSFVIGAVTFIPFAIFEFAQNPNWINNVSQASFWGIIYGIFLSSFAAYSLWQWGLSKLSANRVGFFFYLDPVVATIVAVILLSEVVTGPFIIGSLLIFAGLFIAEGRLPYHHPIHQLKQKSK